MYLKVAAALAAVSLAGCTSVSPFLSHISHPDRGWPIDERSEWSLDIAGVELQKAVGQFEITTSLGYVLTKNEPERFVSELTVRYRIPLGGARCSTDSECRDLFGGNGGPAPRRVEF